MYLNHSMNRSKNLRNLKNSVKNLLLIPNQLQSYMVYLLLLFYHEDQNTAVFLLYDGVVSSFSFYGFRHLISVDHSLVFPSEFHLDDKVHEEEPGLSISECH